MADLLKAPHEIWHKDIDTETCTNKDTPPMKHTAFFDIETNGIEDWATLSDLKTVHSMVVIDPQGTHRYREHNIQEGLDRLAKAESIVGHNAIGFDAPALWKLYGFKHPNVMDSAVLARVTYPDVGNEIDDKREDLPKEIRGSHSLKAWGKRIGVYKDDHGETEDWSQWSPEMEEYCGRT